MACTWTMLPVFCEQEQKQSYTNESQGAKMTESIANLTGYCIHLNRRHIYIFLIHHLKHRDFLIMSFFQSSYSSDCFPYALWRTHEHHKLCTEFQV